MTKAAVNSNVPKSKGLVFLEYFLFALCLCVIALRATFTEGPAIQSAGRSINLDNSVYSLSISAGLFLSFVAWFVWSIGSKRFVYRFSGMEIGLCLFCIAACLAGLAAANKRAAVTDFAVLIAPPVMAVLLVQILDSQAKIKLLLICIAALGVVSAYECADQLFVTNQAMIDQYEQAPQRMLEPLGIQPNTLQHWQFEHRLYSRGVRSFFTNSNSAGSFALLASFAAVALFINKFRNRKSDTSVLGPLIACGIAVAVVIFGLAITKSKGAIAAASIAGAMFIAYLSFGDWLKRHKKAILIACLLLALAGGSAVVLYGTACDRLPGGNSMLVRWQYWQASARMYADHPFTGVGPGNFVHFYPRYKPAEALETVTDPHNFLLRILTGYGPLGLVGFLALILVPLWRLTSAGPVNYSPEAYRSGPAFRKLVVPCVIVISAALLLVRPIVMPVKGAVDTPGVMAYVIFTLYIVPVAVFIVGFWLLTVGGQKSEVRDQRSEVRLLYSICCPVLFCAVIGCLIHNLIDFAIFEPGVLMAFWAIMACLIALDSQRKSRAQVVLRPRLSVKILISAAGLALAGACLYYAWWPVCKSTAKIQQAHRAVSNGQLQSAHNLLAAAAKDDCLSPAASSLNGRLYLHHFYVAGQNGQDLLAGAEDNLLEAINRNRADFKNFERLTEVYTLLAETSTQQKKTDWLNKAFDNALLAVERYPGSGRLRVELAEIAEQLHKNKVALEQYKKAIDIEDSYRRQFRQMYPGREMFSRLGEEKYENAKQRVKHLSEKSTP